MISSFKICQRALSGTFENNLVFSRKYTKLATLLLILTTKTEQHAFVVARK